MWKKFNFAEFFQKPHLFRMINSHNRTILNLEAIQLISPDKNSVNEHTVLIFQSKLFIKMAHLAFSYNESRRMASSMLFGIHVKCKEFDNKQTGSLNCPR